MKSPPPKTLPPPLLHLANQPIRRVRTQGDAETLRRGAHDLAAVGAHVVVRLVLFVLGAEDAAVLLGCVLVQDVFF